MLFAGLRFFSQQKHYVRTETALLRMKKKTFVLLCVRNALLIGTAAAIDSAPKTSDFFIIKRERHSR